MGGLGTRPADAPVAMENPAVENAPAPAPPSPAAPSADEMELLASLERKFHQIETHVDCFALLGVPRTATDDEVKAAFLDLAKVFHPDRLPGSLHHLLPKMRAVFESVREAYGTLQSESSRAIYEAGLGSEAPPKESSLNPAEEAAEAFKRGEILFRKRDYPGAEFEYHRAYLLDAKANYLAAEAWAIHLNPERREKAPVAKQMMVEASKKDPNCERAQYQLGVIARVEGDIDRAEKHFREAVRLNSKHLEARQELRLIEMRKKKGRSR
jgi:curved DNA-binding protein CbpA